MNQRCGVLPLPVTMLGRLPLLGAGYIARKLQTGEDGLHGMRIEAEYPDFLDGPRDMIALYTVFQQVTLELRVAC